jgi:hypothetical protein
MDLTSRGGFLERGIPEDVSVLSPKEKPKRPEPKAVPYRGPPDLVAEIDAAAEALGLSRNEAMTQLLRFALEAHRKEQKKAKK